MTGKDEVKRVSQNQLNSNHKVHRTKFEFQHFFSSDNSLKHSMSARRNEINFSAIHRTHLGPGNEISVHWCNRYTQGETGWYFWTFLKINYFGIQPDENLNDAANPPTCDATCSSMMKKNVWLNDESNNNKLMFDAILHLTARVNDEWMNFIDASRATKHTKHHRENSTKSRHQIRLVFAICTNEKKLGILTERQIDYMKIFSFD